MTVDTLKWNGLAKKSGVETGDVISEFKTEILDRPNKAIDLSFCFIIVIWIWLFKLYRR